MSLQSPALLLDTNIWVDLYDSDRPHHADALALVSYAAARDVSLTYFAGSAKDVFYILAAQRKAALRAGADVVAEADANAINEIAWGCIENMQEIAMPVPLDLRTLWMARKLKGVSADFEDDLVLAACELGDVDYLVTGDAALRSRAPIAAMSAAEALDLLEKLAAG